MSNIPLSRKEALKAIDDTTRIMGEGAYSHFDDLESMIRRVEGKRLE